MSNLIPPLLSSSPPPISGPLDEEDDDEFGNFRAASDLYDCDDLSLPPSPQKSLEKELKTDNAGINLDINCNKSQISSTATNMPNQDINESLFENEQDKDFQDKRKSIDNFQPSKAVVNSSVNESETLESISNYTEPAFLCSSKVLDKRTGNVDSEGINSKIDKQEILEDQNCDKIVINSSLEELFVSDSVTNSEEGQEDQISDVITEDPFGDGSEINIERNEDLFDGFSESVQARTSSEDIFELNEINEIKSEDGIEEISFEISERNNDKDYTDKDTVGESLKVIKCDGVTHSSVIVEENECDAKLTDDEFGDFANFDNEIIFEKTHELDDEFDDFVNPLPPTELVKEQSDDDFGDFESSEFADFSSQSCENPILLEVNEKNAVDKSTAILNEVFPALESNNNEFISIDDTKDNRIFNELKDITETNALMYQWSKSNSQKMFFKALNIDTRNILYGPAWNGSMPRFAANLAMTPLEPVKSEILSPTPVQNIPSPSSSSQKSNSDIPSAQFDWNGSGLVNPLDSTSSELPATVPEDFSQQQGQNDFLPLKSEKADSGLNLFDTRITENNSTLATNLEALKIEPKTEISKENSSFQSPKLIPLRETHISNELNDFGSKPGWLQPTIVTPDLPRKQTTLNSNEDDEFDEFQMVLPEVKKSKTIEEDNKEINITLDDLCEFEAISEQNTGDTNIEHPKHIVDNLINKCSNNSAQKQIENVNEDDEFTDFHSSVPPSEPFKPLQPITLKPIKSTVQNSAFVTQINWPNPGVTDEDIRNIELTYSRKIEPNESKPDVNVKTNKTRVSKNNSLDDEEWTDFVSVTRSPKTTLPERTSTPDLPLSVLNLNSVQAPKQPIPVITPSGLVQTKLSTNITLQPKSVVQTMVQPNMFKPPMNQIQPSLISSQFAANFPAGNSDFSVTPSTKIQDDDDDDWSDFVSSQPPPTQVNGLQPKVVVNHSRTPHINWTNATTNIIMNPQFETFHNYPPPQSKKVTTMSSRNTVPSISTIPDLEFIAPKSRTSKK